MSVQELLSGYERLCGYLIDGEDIGGLHRSWDRLSRDIGHMAATGQLTPGIAGAAATIARNAQCLLEHHLGLHEESTRLVNSFRDELTHRLSTHTQLESHQSHLLGSKSRRCSESHSGTLRDWFLAHLPHPYPTYTEKKNLAFQAGIPMSKIDSDLTNWRRRSGWGEICEIYARKSKDKMKMLMLRVQRGEETHPDLLERVEGIRRYMDKECDKVGDWVLELASFARPEKRPKLDHASPTDTTPNHGAHRSISSVSSSSSLSDISAFATMDSHPSDAHTRDSPPTRSVSGSSTLSDASDIVPSQGPKRSMSFTDDVEQVANKAKTSHTPLRAEPAWVGSPTEYASSDTSGFSGTYVSLDAASNSLSSFTAASESSLPTSGSDNGQPTGADLGVGSATAVSNVLTVADSIMSSECSSIWSTELELPSLPHMHSGSASSWRIPTLSEFRPEIGRWVERG